MFGIEWMMGLTNAVCGSQVGRVRFAPPLNSIPDRDAVSSEQLRHFLERARSVQREPPCLYCKEPVAKPCWFCVDCVGEYEL